MEKLLFFDYSALVIDIVILGCMLLRKMTNGKLNKVFIFLAAMAVFTNTIDIIAVSFDKSGGLYIVEKMVYHSIYLLLRAFTSFFCMSYIIVLTDSWYKAVRTNFKKLLLFFPLLLAIVLMISNIFTNHVFYIDDAGVYTRGKLFFLLYVINAYYVVYGFYKVFINRRMLSLAKMFSIYVGSMLMISAAVVQFMMPNVLIDMFANATGLLFLFMMVQRPDEITDNETGLIKLSAYDFEIRRSFTNHKRETLIMLKITNYTVIREMLGYNDSVCVKKKVADTINAVMKELRLYGDVYYTEGGNYRIVTDEKNMQKITAVAQRLNDEYKESIDHNGMKLNLIMCICITVIPDDIDNIDALVALGEDLKNQYTGNVLFASEISSKVRYNIMRDMDMILENAVSADEFEIYYQPIFSLREERFTSAEALIRLKTEKYGYISPEIFIPAAEKSGSIHRIGQIVMEKVCEFIGSEQFAQLGLDYIEINLSPAQCMEDNLAKKLIEIMKKNNVLPDQVNFEITETASGEIQNTIMKNIRTLHSAGISLSLDDFGTGYSNMTRIAALPFRIIKLDKTFTRIDSNPNMVIVLENVIKMIKALNMKIVVEGIETKELVEKFRKLDCEYIQGFYYSKPLPKEKFVEFMLMNNKNV